MLMLIWLSKDYQQRYQVDQACCLQETGERWIIHGTIFSQPCWVNRRANDGVPGRRYSAAVQELSE